MTKDTALQGVVTAAAAAVGAYFHQLLLPVALLGIAMMLDYISGMANAWIKRELSSKAGVIGIIKKIGYMVAVAVAILVDQVIRIAAEQTGVGVGIRNIFALLVTIWLLLNECISILENLAEIGVPVPEFLLKIIKRLKQSAENTGGEDEKKGKKDKKDGEGNGDK